MSYARFTLNTPLDATQLKADLRLSGAAVDGFTDLQKLGTVLSGNADGRGTHVRVATNGVRASGTATFAGLPTAAQTITINGVAFTARASGAVANEFNIGASGAATAVNLAAAINASTTAKIKNIITADVVGAVVTLTCLVPGSIGLLCTLANTLTNVSISGATLTGGSEDNEVVINAGRVG